MFSGDSLPGGYNNDVLNAQPSTAESREKLVEELKERAKGSIGSRNYPGAVELYTKAIEVVVDNDAAKAILHANRSMCHMNMNNAELALADANAAEALDPSYVKTYYRKAAACKALKDFDGAKDALLKGISLKPDDKEWMVQLAKLGKEQASSAPSSVKPARTTISTSSGSSSSGSSSSGNGASKPAAKPAAKPPAVASAPKPPAKKEEEEEVDDEDEMAQLNLRGYKKTADGRTTTFFNNELDEAAKKLIGDIAPKKMDAQTPQATVDPTAGSAWNSAGTYEERILTPWAMERLKSGLGSLAMHVDAAQVPNSASYANASAPLKGLDVSVSEVEGLTGDAQVSVTRGKRKHLCDFSMTLKWSLSVQHASTEVVTGKISLLDVSADGDYELQDVEVEQFNGTKGTFSSLPKFAQQVVTAFVKSSSAGLQPLVAAELKQFCADLKSK